MSDPGQTYEYPPPGGGRRVRRSSVLTALVLALSAAAGAGAAVGHRLWPASPTVVTATDSSQPAANVSPQAQAGGGNSVLPYGAGGGGGAGSTPDEIAARVDPALVDINVTLPDGEGAGTGIVLTSSGEVLTNNHVIAGATGISVTDVGNGQTYSAKVVGYDAGRDVAVIQLDDASGLQTADLGDSSTASAGDDVLAIGNAGGAGGTPSAVTGTITALDRTITAGDALNGSSEQLTGLIQVDADVQPGDSGGPLVDAGGRVIGMDTAASQGFSFDSSGNEGYAIPIEQAVAIARQIEAGRESDGIHVGETAFLGVQIAASADAGGQGAAIDGVVDGAPAQAAGLAGGDLITSLDGQAVDSATTLTHLLAGYHPGDEVRISWTDPAGQSHTATLHLGTGAAA